eukprot:1157377-Pelagomonas_calceolata.AAC.5
MEILIKGYPRYPRGSAICRAHIIALAYLQPLVAKENRSMNWWRLLAFVQGTRNMCYCNVCSSDMLWFRPRGLAVRLWEQIVGC